MPGLLVNGTTHAVEGLRILSPNDEPWCKLAPGDGRPRPTRWVRQIVLHTTNGLWPQPVRPGKGSGGKAKVIAEGWRLERRPSAAHLVIDNDGTVACLCDLATVEAFHATVSNAWSIGIELFQEQNGGVHEAVYDSAVKLVPALCRIFGIQFQMPKLPYRNAPLRRMMRGGADCVGVFGHRHNTTDRGRGDPGDEIFMRLAAAGAESFDFDAGEDLEAWKLRQQELNLGGAGLQVDGVPGPNTAKAIQATGRAHGLWVFKR
jgi:hypothetical protein